MAKKLPFTLAFLHQKPLAAGRALAAMSPEEVAVFLDAIPTRIAAPALTAMGAWSASAVLSKMSATSAAAILGTIDYLDAAAILRHSAVADRERVLADLPKKLRRDFETSLVFPDSTVGAHMTTAFMTLTEQHICSDAINLIRRSAMVNPDVILIVDASRKLAGAVTASGLVRHSSNTPLGEIMGRDIEPLSARSRLIDVERVSGWDNYPALPVVSRQQHVIGLLLRKSVSGADDRHAPFRSQSETSIPISMFEAFIVSLVGVTQTLVGTRTSTSAKVRANNE